jgi:sodium/pantothenate symporter
MSAESGPANWTIVTFSVYILAVFLLAVVSRRFSRKRAFLKEYYLGSRGLGGWLLALTFAATSASGGSFTGFPSLIYTYGWIMALWIAGYMVVPLCGLGLFGKRLNQVARKSDAVTIPDVFRDRFNSVWLGLLTTCLLVFFLIVFLVAQFKAGGILLQTLLQDSSLFQAAGGYLEGLPRVSDGATGGYLVGLVVFAATVVFYTAYGGFRAVVWTDVMQGLIMVFGVMLLLPLTVHKAYVYLSPVEEPSPIVSTSVPSDQWYAGHKERSEEVFRFSQLTEGLEKVNDHLEREDPAALTGPGWKEDRTSNGSASVPFLPLGMAISFFFIWPIGGAGATGNMVRLMAFRDSKSLGRAIVAVCVYFGLIYIPLVVIFVTAKTLPLQLEQPDQVMPVMAIFASPPVLAGLLIAAPFAAVMSTVDSFLLIISSSLVRDIYQRNINPHASERSIKRLSLATTVFVGGLVFFLAINPPRFLQDLVVFVVSGQTATFLVAMAMTLYWPRANACGVACAMWAGFCGVGGMYLIGWAQTGSFAAWTPFDLHPFMWGLVTSLAGGVVGSLVGSPPDRRLVAKYFFKARTG